MVALVAAAGIAVGHFLFAPLGPWLWVFGIALLIGAIGLAVLGRRSLVTIGVLLSVFAGFCLLHSLRLQKVSSPPYLEKLQSGEALLIDGKGTVTSLSQGASGTAGRRAYAVRLEEISFNGEVLSPNCSVRLVCRREGLTRGDQVTFRGVYRFPLPPRNPGSFDAREQLFRSGLSAEVACSQSGEPTVTGAHSIGRCLRSRRSSEVCGE